MESAESAKARRDCLERDGVRCHACEYAGECRHCVHVLTDRDEIEAWTLWESSRTQVRATFAGICGIDYSALKIVADIQGVEIDAWMLHMVQALEYDMLAEQNEQTKKQQGET